MTVSGRLPRPLQRAGGRACHGHAVLAFLANVDTLVERLGVIGGINFARASYRAGDVVALGARLHSENQQEENCSGFHRNELADLAARSREQSALIPSVTSCSQRVPLTTIGGQHCCLFNTTGKTFAPFRNRAACPAPRAKIYAFPNDRTYDLTKPSRPPKGRFAIVTKRGAGCDGRIGAVGECTEAYGQAVWS
jgi:hypothetical protein